MGKKLDFHGNEVALFDAGSMFVFTHCPALRDGYTPGCRAVGLSTSGAPHPPQKKKT